MKRNKIYWLAAFIILCAPVFATADLKNNTVAYYSYDNASVNTSGTGYIEDLSYNNWNASCTWSSVLAGQTGIINQSFKHFAAGYCEVAPSISLPSIKAWQWWIKPNVTIDTSLSGSPTLWGTSAVAPFKAFWLGNSVGAFANEIVTYYDGTAGDRAYYWSSAAVSSMPANQWYHIVVSWNSTSNNYDLYVNGSYKGGATQFNVPTEMPTHSNIRVGADRIGDDFDLGLIDEFAIFNDTLDQADITELWNNGTALQYPFVVVAPTSYMEITATNYYNSTSLNNLTANVTYNGTTTQYTTTNGTIVTSIIRTFELPVNISLNSNESGGFFTNTTLNHNSTSNAALTLFQAQVTFSASEIFTGNAVTGFNAVAPLQSNYDTNPSLYLSAGSYNITFFKSGWYNFTIPVTVTALSNTSETFTGVYQFLANITYINYISSATVNTFTANLTGASYTAENTTTNGSLYVAWINETNVNITVNATGYALTSVLRNITSNLTNISILAYPDPNIISITILSEDNGSLLSGYNITVTVTNLTSSYTNTTTTGYEYVENLGFDNYTVSVTSGTFPLRTYGVQFGSTTEILFLTAYLSANANSSTIITTRSAITNAVIEGCTVSVQRVINSSWTTIQASVTDVTGTTYLNYVPLTMYRFAVACEGYETKTFILNPIVFSSYTVLMDRPTGTYNTAYDFGGVSIIFSPQTFYNGNNSFSIIFSSGDGTFTSYGFNLTYPINSTADSGINAYGEQFTTGFNITNAGVFDTVNLSFYYDTTLTDQKTFNYSFSIRSNSTTSGTFIRNQAERYGLGYFEAALIVTVITLLVAGAAAFYAGTIASGVVIVLMLSYFMYIGMLPLWAGILSLLTGFVLITWRVGN